VQAGAEIGFKPPTTYGHICHGTFPLPLIKRGNKNVVSIYALATFLGGGDPFAGVESRSADPAPTPIKRGPGRPRKIAAQPDRDPRTLDFIAGNTDAENGGAK
jgi:hypothetical protein